MQNIDIRNSTTWLSNSNMLLKKMKISSKLQSKKNSPLDPG